MTFPFAMARRDAMCGLPTPTDVNSFFMESEAGSQPSAAEAEEMDGSAVTGRDAEV